MKAFYFHGKLKKNVQQNLLTGPQLALDKLHNLHSVLYQRHMSNRPTTLYIVSFFKFGGSGSKWQGVEQRQQKRKQMISIDWSN